MSIHLFDNFLTNEEVESINDELKSLSWKFEGYPDCGLESLPIFWYKEIIHTKSCLIIKNNIEKNSNKKINVQRAYVNGQAHSQSGFWHKDVAIYADNTFTLVYFVQDWLPEYGGHLMIKNDKEDIISILPEKNRAIIFHSHLTHMGLEPSRYCKKQRESIAIKFTLES